LASLKKAMDATHEYQSVRDAAKSAIRKIEKPKSLSVNNILPFRPASATVSGHERNSILDSIRRDVGES